MVTLEDTRGAVPPHEPEGEAQTMLADSMDRIQRFEAAVGVPRRGSALEPLLREQSALKDLMRPLRMPSAVVKAFADSVTSGSRFRRAMLGKSADADLCRAAHGGPALGAIAKASNVLNATCLASRFPSAIVSIGVKAAELPPPIGIDRIVAAIPATPDTVAKVRDEVRELRTTITEIVRRSEQTENARERRTVRVMWTVAIVSALVGAIVTFVLGSAFG